MRYEGIFLPIITPFKNDEVDFNSYKKLIDYYISKGIAGIIPLGTTGESPVINQYEYESILDKTVEYVHGRIPIIAGLGGNHTWKVVKELKTVEKYKVQGILSVCPYYSRPDQKGIIAHFSTISQCTDMDIIMYNIPYRTGTNIENSTIRCLAEIKNIVGLKDSCGDIRQTMELLLNPPENFSILTGEDMLFYNAMTLGAQGAILASAHLNTEEFIDIYQLLKGNDHKEALVKWKSASKLIPLLFKEPNPTPIKYCLKTLGLIESSEVRLPLVDISKELERELEKLLFDNQEVLL